tara:strand:- start:329 stop:844 length:516 start_codon:yes stop_codon:yes gene_type:complete
MSATERWTNDDGLNVRFGTERAALSVEGHVSTMGDEQEAVFSITGTDITSADALLSAHPTVGIPDGSHIISATLYVTTAFTSGGSATLTMGLWNDDGDGTFSVNDADGIDAAVALTAIDAVGDHLACDGALVGSGAAALAGTGDRPLFVSLSYGTAAFTAGAADLVIKYRR